MHCESAPRRSLSQGSQRPHRGFFRTLLGRRRWRVGQSERGHEIHGQGGEQKGVDAPRHREGDASNRGENGEDPVDTPGPGRGRGPGDLQSAQARGKEYPEDEPHRSDQERPALTQRERSVLALAAEGLPTSEIAAQLHVASATVKSHLQSAYGKLDVRDRASAVAAAMRRGLLK